MFRTMPVSLEDSQDNDNIGVIRYPRRWMLSRNTLHCK